MPGLALWGLKRRNRRILGPLRISVALCTYNGEAYLLEQLESLERQERLPDELVVFDDRSDDRTVGALRGFAERAPFPVILEVNPERVGTARNFDRAIRRCTGEIIALCDQDDVWLPERLARSEAFLEAHREVGFCFGDAELVDDEGRPLDRRLWEAIGFTARQRGEVERGGLLALGLRRRVVTGATMTLRSGLVDLVSPIPEVWPHDAWAALVCSYVSACGVIPEPLIRYRIHAGQQIGVGSLEEGGRSRGSQEGRSERHRLAAERYEAVVDRIVEAVGRGWSLPGPEAERALSEMKELVRHHRVRAALPEARLRRLPMVLREWRSGGYRRLARGPLSALKDLVS